MKNLSLFKVLFMALAIFAISSCGDDGTTDPIVLDPTISFLDGAGFITTDTELAPGESFTVNIRGDKGDNDLNSLTIYEDGLVLDFSRITFAHTTTANNPQLIADTDRQGLNWEVTIVAQSGLNVVNYDFELTDTEGNTDAQSLNISTETAGVLEVTLSSGTSNCFLSDFTSATETIFCLNANATRGGFELSEVTIYEDNDVIDISRLTGMSANPMTLEGDDLQGFNDLEVSINSHSDAGAREYRVVVSDADGSTAEAGIFVTIGSPATELTGVLLNQAGPPGTGGLDLDDAVGTGSMDPNAHIKDEGIDISLPVDANWIQKISGANGSIIRSAANLPDGFKFDNIAISEEIQGAFDNADALGTNSDGDSVTGFVNVDDQFVVQNGTQYFFIKITAVSETDTNNDDSYTMSIKF